MRFILKTAFALPNLAAVSDKLYQVPVTLGRILQLIFGQKLTETFIVLLSTHIIQLEAAITALKSGDNQVVNDICCIPTLI